MITRIHTKLTLVKHILCDYTCKCNSTACNSNQKWNNNKYQCERKKYCTCKKDNSWNPSTCICKNSKNLMRIIDNCVWWNYKCYILCINKCDKYYNDKCTVSRNSDDKKVWTV